METTAVDAPRASGRFHVDPALTAATVGWVLAFGGAFVWRLLVYGLGREVTDWRLLGCVGINAITLVLLWGERRRVLAHAPRGRERTRPRGARPPPIWPCVSDSRTQVLSLS
jgi:hypothetical protein